MKYGINLKIDVSKIQKDKMYKGAKGTYLDAVVFVDVDNKDQYDNNGMIKQSWKDDKNDQTPILGNARVFWSGDSQQQRAPQQQRQTPPVVEDSIEFDDELPF